MLNKKNIAIAMAAATVAMPMTQSFAAVVDNRPNRSNKSNESKSFRTYELKFTEKKSFIKCTNFSRKNMYLNI